MSQREGVISRAEPGEVIGLIVTSGTKFVKRHYVLSSMYLVGILAAVLGTGFAVDYNIATEFDSNMAHASRVTQSELLKSAESLRRAEDLYYRHKGWFTCDEKCTAYYNEMNRVKEQFDKAKAKRDSLVLEARKKVGAWSVYGISDIRREFWNAWEKGKETAKRMTMVDAVFIGIGSMFGNSNRDSDNSFIVTVIQILFQFVMNLTLGLFTSLVIFLFEAWAIIQTYGPSIISALALFMLVVCAAGAVFISTVGGVFAAFAGGVYWVARSAEKNARLDAHSRGARPSRLHWE